MNLEYYIAKRIHFQQDRRNISRPAVRIAITGIALGLAVMWIAIAVILGFKQEIRNKTIGFGGHVRITDLHNSSSMEFNPIVLNPDFRTYIESQDEFSSMQAFASKPAMIKTADAFQGVVVKGVGTDFNWDFFQKHIQQGEILDLNNALKNEVIISKTLANILNLKLGDEFFVYFIQDQIRARKMNIKGIYETYFEEFDKVYLLTDIRQIQKLNGWKDNDAAGYEILLKDYDQMQEAGDKLQNYVYDHGDELKDDYYVETVRDQNPQVFAWLDLLDMNVWVILVLMLLVAGFNMISGLLILILERTNMIGILKSLGATNWSVRKIFLYHTSFLIAKGMLWGNLIGLVLCGIQYYTHWIPLDPSNYYTSYVPVEFNWVYLLLLNLGTLIASVLMMVGPSYLIAKILPSKIIRYE